MLLNSIPHKKTSIQNLPRSIKLVIFSLGLILFLLVMFKGVVVSSSYDIVLCNLKKLWDFLRQLLSSPLFVCFIINFIVILIVASSILETNHFQEHHVSSSSTSIDYHHDHDFHVSLPPPQPVPPLVVEDTNQNSLHSTPFDSKLSYHIQETDTMKKDAAFSIKNHMGSPKNHQDGIFSHQNSLTERIVKAHEPFSIKNDMGSPQNHQDDIFTHQNSLTEGMVKAHEPIYFKNDMESPQNHQDEIFTHQNSLTEGIVNAQKPIESETIKKSQHKPEELEQKVLEIVNTDDDDTLEATWRAITENKTLKKSETWAQPLQTEDIDSEDYFMPKSKKELRKSSMSFNETVSLRFRGGMMRGPSISLEELHGRVEAHIKNFNKEMKLQRQESEQRYLEMLNRNI